MFDLGSLHWEPMSSDTFVIGGGKQSIILDTKYLRICRQWFYAGTHIKPHSHPTEWEIVLGGPKVFCVIPAKGIHDFFSWATWTQISIKIGKKS